jgi:peptidoglycan hydrolase-like protein with peptidoglycan-binding domain
VRRNRDLPGSPSVRRDISDAGGERGPGIAALFAFSAMAVLGTAVLYNAMFAQRGLSPSSPAGTTTRIIIEGSRATRSTVRFSYDPVVEAVQRELLASGFYKGTIDGVAGQRTKGAIVAYQKSAHLPIDGIPTAGLADHVRFTREVTQASRFTGSAAPSAGNTDEAIVRRVQTGLAELAYEPGQIDGQLTRRTRDTIARFQRDRGLPETGEISAALIAELEKMSGQSEIVAGE